MAGSRKATVRKVGAKDKELIGTGYKLKDGKLEVLEHLAIRMIEGKVVYQATVFNQNQGATISFPLNESISHYYSFENLEHDFPKKIQYQQLDKKRIKVNVVGDKEQGFSFVMNQVKP